MMARARAGLGWGALTLLALFVVAYAGAMLATGAFPAPLRPSLHAHQLATAAHIVGGMLALGLLPLQLHPWLRRRAPQAHRWLGRAAVGGMLVGGLAGLALAGSAAGGWAARLGFAAMAAAWLIAAVAGVAAIRGGRVAAHRRWMLRCAALTIAAITLRIWLPLLMFGLRMPFGTAYPIVAWLCWAPNLLVAEAIVRRAGGRAT